ncbi:hypothetical protein PV08_05148 [Exophiala spinifera]|uniref:Major facilitator superfamily (MFS) profile domain-containing protein n=1 Tax=Exophiala spinifera TaxID=91928 RepID=A0A0D2BG50_9EURO|nr:uncharacterized protein PV08_05148 [Exophiala spinifera]KIW17953.1 hypothetical protein PV08_05148 [Exophiala spinifera]
MTEDTIDTAHGEIAIEDDQKLRHVLSAAIGDEATEHVRSVGLGLVMEPRMMMVIFAMIMGQFAGIWGFTLPAGILPFIEEDIGGSSNSALFSIVWTMGNSVGYALVGRLSDIFGRRWWMIGFNALGLVGGAKLTPITGIVAGRAQRIDVLIGSNVLLGLSSGGQFSMQFMSAELVPNRHKLAMLGLVVFGCFPSLAIGSFLGRAVLEGASWRWIYYIYSISCACAVGLHFFFYHPKEPVLPKSRLQLLKELDFIGLFLFVSSIALFVLGISLGGNPYPWDSAKVLGPLVSGVVASIGFFAWELHMPISRQFMRVQLLKDLRGFAGIVVCGAMGGLIFFGLSVAWPSEVYYVYATSTDWSNNAWRTTSLGIGIWVGDCFVSPLIGIFKYAKWQLVVYAGLLTLFLGIASLCTPNDVALGIAMSGLAGVVTGPFEQAPAALSQLFVEDEDLGMAFSLFGGLRSAFGAIGSAVFLSIIHNKVPEQLAIHIGAVAASHNISASEIPLIIQELSEGQISSLLKIPGVDASVIGELAYASRWAYADAYKVAYYAAVAFGAATFLVTLTLRDLDYLLTDHVPRTIAHNAAEARIHDEKEVRIHHEEEIPATATTPIA